MVGFSTVAVVWFDHAACRGFETALWFPERGEVASAEALQLCAGCPVWRECLEASMFPHLEQGIWGGRGEAARRRMRRARQGRRADNSEKRLSGLA